ncbi:MAG: histone deacetylase family protein, partial [Rhodospirillaceae bacterium]|nr:histone deacetylase family protein [Rhodospirillaceae bacterium]
MSTQFYSHPVCLEHDTGPHHPERPDRLRAVMGAIEGDGFQDLVRIDAPKGSLEQI